MPEGYTHVRTAQKAAHAIHYKLQCPAAFAAGANGPDSFFCYEVWKKGQNRTYNLPLLGNRMHEDMTGAFLLALLHHTHTQAQIEYTLGFLCHYAADTVMHPYIVFVSSPGQPYGMKGGHGYFEIALDSTLHAEDTGVSEVPADDSSPVPVGQDLAEIAALLHQCILEVYGQDISVEALADSFYYTYRLRRLFTSRHGVRRAFLKVLLEEPEPMLRQEIEDALADKNYRLARIVSTYRTETGNTTKENENWKRGLQEMSPLQIAQSAFEKIYQVEMPVELTGLFEEAYLAATRKEEEEEE